MAVAHVQAMLPDLHIEQADPAGDAAGLARLAGWCLRHVSPLVAADSRDGIFIDVTGCTHLFGATADDGEAALLTQLTGRLTQAGIAARIAIADTPGAAHALARHGNVAIAPSGSLRKVLAPLPVAALRLPDGTPQTLSRLGFETIGQLMAASRAPLAKRVGSQVLTRLDQVFGDAPEPIEPMLVAEIPRTRLGFPEPIATPEDFSRATHLLCERLCEKLLKKGLGARQVDLVFARIDGATPSIRIGTASASRDPAHLARLLCAKIETIDPGFGIEKMFLSASHTDALGARQTLSELCTETAAPDLAALVDTLANRLGPAKIFRMAPVESDVPERSVRRIAPLPQPKLRIGRTGCRARRACLPRRRASPFSLCCPTTRQNISSGEARPTACDTPTALSAFLANGGKAKPNAGPCATIFGVEDETGQRFWLFRRGDGECLETGDLSWFLHGIFG